MQNEITCLSQLNLFGHCFEPDPISIPITPEEIEDRIFTMMCLEDARYEADMERRYIEAERGEED